MKLDQFWLKVAGVGLAAGLIGGGATLGIAHGWQAWRENTLSLIHI